MPSFQTVRIGAQAKKYTTRPRRTSVAVSVQHKEYIRSIMIDHVANIDLNTCSSADTESFFVADLGDVYRQQQRWKLNLPRVKPHYGEWPRQQRK